MAEPGGLRLRLARALDPELREGPGLSPLNRVVVGVILLSIAVGIAETEPAIHALSPTGFRIAEIAFLVFFLAEYAGRVWTAGIGPRRRGPVDFMLSTGGLIDLAVILATALPFLGLEAAVLRMVRALRILRLARLGRYSAAMRLLGDAVASRKEELIVSVAFGICLMLLAATLLYLVEGDRQPEEFGSIPRAMWWAAATLTTVGYGDAVPMTMLGKALAAVTAVTGIGLIAIPTGILAGAFSDALRAARERRGGGPPAPPP